MKNMAASQQNIKEGGRSLNVTDDNSNNLCPILTKFAGCVHNETGKQLAKPI